MASLASLAYLLCMTDKESDITVAYENGERIVSYEVESEEGPVVLRHSLPDALSHHYLPSGMNEDVPLFEGSFKLGGDSDSYEGDIRWRWGGDPENRVSRHTADQNRRPDEVDGGR